MKSEKRKFAMAGLIPEITGLIPGTIWWTLSFTSW